MYAHVEGYYSPKTVEEVQALANYYGSVKMSATPRFTTTAFPPTGYQPHRNWGW